MNWHFDPRNYDFWLYYDPMGKILCNAGRTEFHPEGMYSCEITQDKVNPKEYKFKLKFDQKKLWTVVEQNFNIPNKEIANVVMGNLTSIKKRFGEVSGLKISHYTHFKNSNPTWSNPCSN